MSKFCTSPSIPGKDMWGFSKRKKRPWFYIIAGTHSYARLCIVHIREGKPRATHTTQCLEAWEKSHLDNKYSVFCEAADGADRLYILCVFIGSTFWQIVLGPHWQCCCFYLVELENKCHSAKRIKIPSVLFTFCVMTTKSNIAECYVSRTPVWQRSLC